MRKSFLIAIPVSALLALAVPRFLIRPDLIVNFFKSIPPTVDIPAPDDAFRKSFKPEEGAPNWAEIRKTRLALVDDLVMDRFAQLDSVLEAAQNNFESNPACEPRLFWLYDVFERPDPSWEPHFSDWVGTSKIRFAALIARAGFFKACGWNARGAGWADEIPSDSVGIMRSRFALAEQDALTAVALRPKSITAYALLIKLSMHQDRGKMSRYAAAAFRVNPVSYQSLYTYMNGLTPRWGGSYPEMEDFLKKFRKLESLNPELVQLEGFADWDRGNLLFHAEKKAAALKILDRALQSGPWWKIQFDRAAILKELGRKEEAVQCYDDVLRDRPFESDAHLKRSSLLFDLGRPEAAMSDYQAAREFSPLDPSFKAFGRKVAVRLTNKAFYQAKAGDLAGALETYGWAIRMDSTHAEAFQFRAKAWIKQNALPQALIDLQRSIQLDPHEISAYQMIDWVLAHSQDWQRIVEYWNDFLILEPKNATGYFERSGTYFHLGNLAASKRDAVTACELGNEEACGMAKRL